MGEAMSGLLADLYSTIDSKKRQLAGLLADPVETLKLGLLNFKNDQNALLDTQSTAYPWTGAYQQKPTPQQQAAAQKQLADQGANMAFAATFIGPTAKTWDALSAKKAQDLAAQGVDPRKIWSETGTWKGPDGKWRQEIPDKSAFLKGEGSFGDVTMKRMKATGKDVSAEPVVANDVMFHSNLYSAYPDLANTEMRFMPNGQRGGQFGSDGVMHVDYNAPNKNATSIISHEMQHAIQQREGWAKGGSPEDFGQQKEAELARDALSWANELKRKAKEMKGADTSAIDMAVRKEYESLGASEMIPKADARQLAMQPYVLYPDKYADGGLKNLKEIVSLYGLDKGVTPAKDMDLYKRLAGEAEARATQARIPLDAAQRRALFPEDSYDVPINQLIIRGLLSQ